MWGLEGNTIQSIELLEIKIELVSKPTDVSRKYLVVSSFMLNIDVNLPSLRVL